jgi:hypothetical protein
VWIDETPTPIGDRLKALVPDRLATFHGQRGGEWDTLRSTSLRVRRRLTSAGFMAFDGVEPDFFTDLLRMYVGTDEIEPDPIAWFIREAGRAITERQYAANRDRHRRLARRAGKPSYAAYRDAWCVEQGHASLWAYRKAKGWA